MPAFNQPCSTQILSGQSFVEPARPRKAAPRRLAPLAQAVRLARTIRRPSTVRAAHTTSAAALSQQPQVICADPGEAVPVCAIPLGTRTCPCAQAAGNVAAAAQRAAHTAATFAQTAYVGTLLLMLPPLLAICRHISPKIQAEADYLESGYTFQLAVAGTGLQGTCQRTGTASFRRVPPALIASDVEPGSGLPSANPEAVTIDYVIEFRSVAYAFQCFSGGMTLQDALAQRAFSTRGPNNTGVALTYMFTAMLRMFFGWRAAYRTAAACASKQKPKRAAAKPAAPAPASAVPTPIAPAPAAATEGAAL